MFNRTIILPGQNRTEYVTREVHEHRAPTDQSVALLKEMEDAAQAKVVDAIKVGDTRFECAVHVLHEPMSDDRLYRAIFSLNGKKLEAQHRERWADRDRDPKAWAPELRDAIAKEIATQILLPALDRLPHRA